MQFLHLRVCRQEIRKLFLVLEVGEDSPDLCSFHISQPFGRIGSAHPHSGEVRDFAQKTPVLDLVIVDTSDKSEIISGFSELVAVIPQAEKMTNEEERQILDIVLDGLPNVNLIDPGEPQFRNAPLVDAISNLMDGLVDSYCENPECIGPVDMSALLSNLKTWYDTLLMTAAQHDTDTVTDTEATEC